MAESMIYDYYYGDESSQFSFYRIPRQLVTGQQFKKISTDAKLLYGLLLDRMGLSARNSWYDDAGRVYIFYTLDEIQEDLNCGHEKAVKLLSELDTRPTEYLLKPLRRRRLPDFRKSEVKKSENQKSRVPIIRSQDFRFSEVQTSENQTVIILNLIKLILAIKINLSIHRLPPSSRDGWIEVSI